jgi:hypothetical protein
MNSFKQIALGMARFHRAQKILMGWFWGRARLQRCRSEPAGRRF